MGAQWKHAGRVANAAKKGAIFGKLIKEILVSAKVGGANADANFRLRTAIEAAKKQSVPRDTIERAIKKGAGLTGETIIYDSVAYEGFTPHQVPVIVECLTDNKNRTASDIRVLFRKGQLGNSGAVAWMFDRVGFVEATTATKGVDLETVAIEAGAQNVEPITDSEEVPAGHTGARFICDPKDLDTVNRFLSSNGWTVSLGELGYQAKNKVSLPADQKAEVVQFLSDIEDNDDVHRIYAAIE